MRFLDRTFVEALLTQHFEAVAAISASLGPSPLLVNGLDLRDGQPVRWHLEDGGKPVMSSLTRQLPLLRAFDLHSAATGDRRFSGHHAAIVQRYFDHYRTATGLLGWGGHIFVDLNSLQLTGPINKRQEHELKDTFPDYDAYLRVDREGTLRFIRAFWAAHVSEQGLVISRHGTAREQSDNVFAELDLDPGAAPADGSDEYSERLTFLNAANDLIYSALKYFQYTGDRHALLAAHSLAARYYRARDIGTGLGVYQYTTPLQREFTDDDNNTMSWFGDRAYRQVGQELGPKALEKNLILMRHALTLYGEHPTMLFALRRVLGPAVDGLCAQVVAGLLAFFRGIYMPAKNLCRPVLIDGTDLSGFTLRRDGYYGKTGTRWMPYQLPSKIASAICVGASLFREEPALWSAARVIFRNLGLARIFHQGAT